MDICRVMVLKIQLFMFDLFVNDKSCDKICRLKAHDLGCLENIFVAWVRISVAVPYVLWVLCYN